MTYLLKILAPTFAVLVGWVLLESAWLALVLYHVQILLWSRDGFGRLSRGWNTRLFLTTALPLALTGPVAYVLLPVVVGEGALGEWMVRYGLSGAALVLMVPYFGLVHTTLEQTHWGVLREKSWISHLAFAGYHGLVLYTLLPALWLALVVTALGLLSFTWLLVQRRTRGGLIVPLCGHILADLGMVLVAWFGRA